MPIQAVHSCVKLKTSVKTKMFSPHNEKIWKEMSNEHKIKAEEFVYIVIIINAIQYYLNKATYFSLVFCFFHALWISEVYIYYLQVHLEKRSQIIVQGKALNIQALITNRNCNDYGA